MKRTKLINTINLLLLLSISSLVQAEAVGHNLNTAKLETHSQLQKQVQSLSVAERKLYQQLNFNSDSTNTKRANKLSKNHKLNANQRNFGSGYGSGYGSRQARN